MFTLRCSGNMLNIIQMHCVKRPDCFRLVLSIKCDWVKLANREIIFSIFMMLCPWVFSHVLGINVAFKIDSLKGLAILECVSSFRFLKIGIFIKFLERLKQSILHQELMLRVLCSFFYRVDIFWIQDYLYWTRSSIICEMFTVHL